MRDDVFTPGPRRDRSRRRRQLARRRLAALVVLVLVVTVVVAAFVSGRGGGEETAGAGGQTPTANAAASSGGAESESTTPPPKVWEASASDPVRVWVGGDSMAGELGWSLGPMLEETRVFTPILYYKESSGTCRWDFFDWGEKMTSVMKNVRPDAVVMMVGTNDTQSVWRDGGWILYGDPTWKKAYQERVSDMIATALERGSRRVYWVGMPAMGEEWRNPRMRFINKIVRKAVAEHPGARYVDAWELFTDGGGDYEPSLRLADGVHFTVEGQQILSTAVFKAITNDWLPDGLPSPSASPSAGTSSL